MSSAKKHIAKFERRKGPRVIHMAGKRGELNRIYADHGLKMQGYGTHMVSLCVEFPSAVNIQAGGGNRTFDVVAPLASFAKQLAVFL